MKFRRRKAIRRRGGATKPAPPPIPPPPDLTTEIEQSVEARDKLKIGIVRFAAELNQSKSAFLRSFASEMSSVVIDARQVLDKFAAWQAQEARATLQVDALNRLWAMFKERVEQFKSKSKGESADALRRIIERLTAERDKPGADKSAIDKRIERLLAEHESLSATTTTPAPQPTKNKTRPTQRPAPSKPQPRERGEN